MNVLFATQSESLGLFHDVKVALSPRLPIERAGFLVADSLSYGAWLKEHPEFEDGGSVILKEWEVTAQRHGKPNLAKLRAYEERLGDRAGLFGAVVADRRLLMGPDCAYTQDYRRRFSDDELLCILQNGVEQIERVFDELTPQLLVGFICVTMLDYLSYLVARSRGVRVLNLRPTRIGDRVACGSLLNDPDPFLAHTYDAIRADAGADFQEARSIVARTREANARYEGVVAPSDRPALAVEKVNVPTAIARVAANYKRYRSGPASTDNHVPHPLRTLAFAAVVNPMRARRTRQLFDPLFVRERDLASLRFAFFPLHTEPEVSLLVYGRPFVNQLEVVRALALSLPVDMVLLVKEHPWMVGKRSVNAYRKLLNIPRVKLVSPALDARTIVQHAELVAVITGSIALEAAMLGRPVITFGDCPYNLLPDSMVRRIRDLRSLPAQIAELLRSYRSDDHALQSYVAAVLATSASVNLYSVLLRKRKVHAERAGTYDEEIRRLSDYLLSRSASPEFAAHPRAAQW